MEISILRLPEVKTRTGLSQSTIYQRIAEGTFPKPISIGARAIGFDSTEIDFWIDSQIRSSREEGAGS